MSAAVSGEIVSAGNDAGNSQFSCSDAGNFSPISINSPFSSHERGSQARKRREGREGKEEKRMKKRNLCYFATNSSLTTAGLHQIQFVLDHRRTSTWQPLDAGTSSNCRLMPDFYRLTPNLCPVAD
ncbi:hypothetical protein M5K25_003980 [Dendrobium thyrsiflorum]|uniref:Uncharacterized protein n=1 Tax=Dendrobium thyrsiflorum TaxID=117978 RepID=A0ABD0VT58_DENTH